MPAPQPNDWVPPEVAAAPPDWTPPEVAAATAPAAPAAPTYPVGGFWSNVLGGVKMGAEKLGAGAAQRVAGLANPETGESYPEALPEINKEAARVRQYYDPLSHTWGGNIGEGALYALPAMVPGMNTALGAAALGGAVGAAQPTVGNEDWRTNALVSSLLAGVGQKAGSALGSWATSRAAEPLGGFTREGGDKALAQAVGSDAPSLTRRAAQDVQERLEGIYQAARSPHVDVPLDATAEQQAYSSALGRIENPSSGATFENNKAVTDYLSHATSPGKPPTAAQLGDISTRLRQQADAIFSSERGDYDLGQAYSTLRHHVDDLIQGSIPDPQLAADYARARPQYAIWKMVENKPQLYKAATGEANMGNIGNYLQRNDPELFRTLDNPLYQYARWGQATGEGKAPSGLKERLVDALVNNPASRTLGGLSSQVIARGAPAAGAAGQVGARQALPLINALRGVPASQWIPPALAPAAAPQ